MSELDERVRDLLAAGETAAATNAVLRELGPELLGFLSGVLANADADEVYASLLERLWRSLSGFEGRCSIRTWAYVLARRELFRFRKANRRRFQGRVPISDVRSALAAAKTRTRTSPATHNRRTLVALRDALPADDRTLLILRVDRNLPWDDIALVFADAPETLSREGRKREAARLRKRFQLVKQRLMEQVQATSAVSGVF
jgi:RNA polymerase sigma-70 factor (ECF subfamily)